MKKIAAVIVTYNNVNMLKELLHDLLAQTRPLDEIIVVDNASSDGTEQMVKDNFTHIKYIRMSENTGTAGGYYEGIKNAMEHNDLIWTLDDDVSVPLDSLEELIKGFEYLEHTENVGVVRSVGKKNPQALPKQMAVCYTWRGSLIKSELFKKIGMPSKDFFIYGEDTEYSLILTEKGYSFFWIPTSQCTEKRTDDKKKYILFGKEVIVYKEAFRLYYAFRNAVYLYLKHRYFKQVIMTIFYGLEVILCIIAYENLHGLYKIKTIIKGVIDGFHGKLGKINI